MVSGYSVRLLDSLINNLDLTGCWLLFVTIVFVLVELTWISITNKAADFLIECEMFVSSKYNVRQLSAIC